MEKRESECEEDRRKGREKLNGEDRGRREREKGEVL